MMKIKNTAHIEGYLYSHKLERKVFGPQAKQPGVEYINGSIDVATDEDCTNIITVFYRFVTPTYGAKGNSANPSFGVLANIENGSYKTVMAVGKDNALKVRIDTSIALNDFPNSQTGEMISAKRFEGGFIHVSDVLAEKENDRNMFECDMLITNVRHVDADEERNLPEKAIIKGATFDFRKALLPVEFSVVNPNAINYFEGQEITGTNPMLTRVRGRVISQTIVKTFTEESAFGEAYVRETKSSTKDWIITWAKAEPYDWDDESTLTAAEVNEAIKVRELYLADVKRRSDEYKASKNTPAPPAPKPTTTDSPVANQNEFKF